jgi:DNA-binding transcriptional ArsR family regulator
MINAFTTITKSLSDPNRVRILMALHGGELCVCRIIELLQLAPSTVSKHITVLKQAGLVEGRKEGRWMHYRLPGKENASAWNILSWVFESLDRSSEIAEDCKRLEQIKTTDLNELTQIYRK